MIIIYIGIVILFIIFIITTRSSFKRRLDKDNYLKNSVEKVLKDIKHMEDEE